MFQQAKIGLLTIYNLFSIRGVQQTTYSETMKKYFSLCLVLACACVDHDTQKFDKASAMNKVAILCDTSSSDLAWLSEILDKAQKGGSLQGSVYAFRYSKGVAIVHQPVIMSCFPCALYDCSGTLITDRAGIEEEIVQGVKNENLILKP
jgi:hypothetical protein